MSRILAGFFALVLSLVALALNSPRALAEPALWSVRDADSTIYLFGTFHVLPAELDWHSDKIRTAFGASEELWVEAVQVGDAEMQQIVARYGIGKEPLSRKLSLTERRQLVAAAKAAGLSPDIVMAFRPWLAAVSLTFATAQQMGLSPEAGVDRQLELAATSAGKRVLSFETMEQQIRFFHDMPAEAELDMLRQTLNEFAKGPVYLQEMIDDWEEGDVAGMEEKVNAGMRQELPELYDILIVRRNAAWLQQIEKLMAGAGTHFIAVGAGHLVGPDGLPGDLAERGYTVIRE